MTVGWHKLIPPANVFHGEGNYRLDAYSEYVPPSRVGWKPYGDGRPDPDLFVESDPYGWWVNEFEETLELRAGLEQVGKQVIHKLCRLLDGDPDTGIPKLDLDNNPYWPAELAAEPKLQHERCVTLLPLALSRTQDDKGRVRWTLFGNSEQGPGRAFWKSFFTTPKKEMPQDEAIGFFCRLLNTVYGEQVDSAAGLKKAGFRILPDDDPLLPHWAEPLPKWTADFRLPAKTTANSAKYLLTFRPFGQLPPVVRKAYLRGKLHLLPFPGSLAYCGVPGYRQLYRELPLALQIPLLFSVTRHSIPEGLRVPQAGYLYDPTPDRPHAPHHAGHIRNTYKRTHRWDKVLRDQDELTLLMREHKLYYVLFSTAPEDIDLYDKPMARNVQMWTEDHRLLLDGPNATPDQLKHAMRTVQAGGLFGYRFHFPAMQVGQHEVYWHRPLVAYRAFDDHPVILTDTPTGYLTAYQANQPNPTKAVELWPRFHRRPAAVTTLLPDLTDNKGFAHGRHLRPVRELMDTFVKWGRPLPRSFARQLVGRGHGRTLNGWLESLPEDLASEVRAMIVPDEPPLPRRKRAKVPDSLTYRRTANRKFEVNYWNTIASLSEGTYANKNNADCVQDATTLKLVPDHDRHLDRLADYLLAYYARKIAAAGMTGKARTGSLPFRWRTDFDFSWMGGWLKNQEAPAERNLIVVIPGKNRKQAVIMADHYDTAYMADRYYIENGGCGARLAANGADDNHSATAAMMLAAPVFLEMSKKGELACDIWLVHLTGEEFPADCLGARALTQRLVERSLVMHQPNGTVKDLSDVAIRGLYVSDMIAHNNDHERDIFQISPGGDANSLWVAQQAHIAAEIWNESVPVWNQQPERVGKKRSRRSLKGADIPEVAPFLALSGEIRTPLDPRSTLFNTDGQIFSDAGVPCVLFMENYDINRTGYHDTHDTMENIDLDYGAAFCAITIESVARAATATTGPFPTTHRRGKSGRSK
jgi:hypothetical protein